MSKMRLDLKSRVTQVRLGIGQLTLKVHQIDEDNEQFELQVLDGQGVVAFEVLDSQELDTVLSNISLLITGGK